MRRTLENRSLCLLFARTCGGGWRHTRWLIRRRLDLPRACSHYHPFSSASHHHCKCHQQHIHSRASSLRRQPLDLILTPFTRLMLDISRSPMWILSGRELISNPKVYVPVLSKWHPCTWRVCRHVFFLEESRASWLPHGCLSRAPLVQCRRGEGRIPVAWCLVTGASLSMQSEEKVVMPLSPC